MRRSFVGSLVVFILVLSSLGAMPKAWAQNATPFPNLLQRDPNQIDWSGPYAGVGVGLSASSVSGISSLSRLTNLYERTGLLGSVLVGVNLQFGSIIIGGEADGTLLGVRGSTQVAAGTLSYNLDWNASLRGRVGLAFGNVLAYGTAGVALTNVSIENRGIGTDTNLLAGWIAGVGLEAALFGGWRLRGEYLYSNANSNRFVFGNGPVYNADAGNHVVRAALVVRFGY